MRILTLLVWVVAAAHAQSSCAGAPAAAVSTVDLGARPFGVAVSADGCHIFVSLMNGGAGKGGIAVLSRKGGRVELLRTIAVPTSPAGIVLTHDGKLLISAAIQQVLFLDVARLISGDGEAVAGSFSDGPRVQSIYANVTADDRLLFVSEESAAAITVIDLERARKDGFRDSAIVGKIPVGLAPIALTFSHDERWLFTTSQLALKDWGWPAACKPEGRPNGKEATNPEGAVLVIDVAKAKSDPAHAVAARVPAGCSPVRLALSPAGDRLYATARNSNAVLAFDAGKLVSDAAHARLGMTAVGTAPVPIVVIDGGRRVVSGNSNRFAGQGTAESLTLLDAAKITGNADAATGTVPAGSFPRELRLSPDGQTLYLANFGSSSLQIMDVVRLGSKPVL